MLDLNKDIWRNKIFLGHYRERRYVHELDDYRDLVVISPAETELIKGLSRFRKEMRNSDGIRWIGIGGQEMEEGSSKRYLWVQFNGLPFGHFWFEIKKAHIQNGEVIFKLKHIRELNKEDFMDAIMEMRTEMNKSISGGFENNPSKMNLGVGTDSLSFNNLVGSIESLLTLENFISVTRFLCITASVLVAEGLTIISKLGWFSLKLAEMLTRFVEVVTPLLIHLMDCLTKIIMSAFYVLLAVMNKNRVLQRPDFPATGSLKYPMRQLSYR